MHSKVRAGRPAGDVRQKIVVAYQVLAERWGHATWRDAAAHAGVEARKARGCTYELVREGALQPVGTVPVPWSVRPMAGYRPAASHGGVPQPGLMEVMRGWGQHA